VGVEDTASLCCQGEMTLSGGFGFEDGVLDDCPSDGDSAGDRTKHLRAPVGVIIALSCWGDASDKGGGEQMREFMGVAVEASLPCDGDVSTLLFDCCAFSIGVLRLRCKEAPHVDSIPASPMGVLFSVLGWSPLPVHATSVHASNPRGRGRGRLPDATGGVAGEGNTRHVAEGG